MSTVGQQGARGVKDNSRQSIQREEVAGRNRRIGYPRNIYSKRRKGYAETVSGFVCEASRSHVRLSALTCPNCSSNRIQLLMHSPVDGTTRDRSALSVD